MEKTFIFIKPDVYDRNLEGAVDTEIKRLFKENNLEIVTEYTGVLDHQFLAYHYAVHLDKPFYESLVEDLENKPFNAYILEGEDAVNKGLNAIKTSIREQFAIDGVQNSIHSSDQVRTANYEIVNFNNFYNK